MQMLFIRKKGRGRRTLYFLHFLGGATSEWAQVSSYLNDAFVCALIDLPGFGDSSTVEGYSVAEMTNAVIECIAADAPDEWILVGHSMGAKVAAAIARQVEDGDARLLGLIGLVLLAGSPPSPEPIPDDRREEMKSWFRDGLSTSCEQAQKYIENNANAPIDYLVKQRSVDDVLRMNPRAWLAWLNEGSREDWSAKMRVLKTPTLIVAGEKDEDLGADAQRRLMLPHFSHARIVTLAGAKHLLPLEVPEQVAELIAAHSKNACVVDASAPHLPGREYRALIDSNRVSEKTRRVLLDRAESEIAEYAVKALTVDEFATLRAIVARVLPQDGFPKIDLAQYIDRQLQGKGDGWRFAKLPGDQEAYRRALRTIDAWAHASYIVPFKLLDANRQDKLLSKLSAGELSGDDRSEDKPLLDAEQMQVWFQDLRADAVKAYMAHPVTLDRIGYSGIADGGDAETMQGFVLIGAGEPEPWEPKEKTVHP